MTPPTYCDDDLMLKMKAFFTRFLLVFVGDFAPIILVFTQLRFPYPPPASLSQ